MVSKVTQTGRILFDRCKLEAVVNLRSATITRFEFDGVSIVSLRLARKKLTQNSNFFKLGMVSHSEGVFVSFI